MLRFSFWVASVTVDVMLLVKAVALTVVTGYRHHVDWYIGDVERVT